MHINASGHGHKSWKRGWKRRDGLKINRWKNRQGKNEAEKYKSGSYLTAEVGEKCQICVSRLPQVPGGAPRCKSKVQFKVSNVFCQCTFHPMALSPEPVIYPQSSNSLSGALVGGKGKEHLRPWFLWLRRLISLHLRIYLFHSSKDDCSNVLNHVCACLMGNVQKHLGTVALVHGKWQLREQNLPLAN